MGSLALDTLDQAEENGPSGAPPLAALRGVISLLGYGINTLFWAPPILLFGVLKRALPGASWHQICDRLQNAMADLWVAVNDRNQRLFSRVRWDVQIPDDLDRRGWHLVLANHRSWVDILVLQRIFHRKIPFLKFFLKKELFWIPILGQVWWALDFPFMKRYPKSYLKRHPERIGMDLDATRRACERFKTVPISVMSFVEGTRYSQEKRRGQKSPYRNLLRARAGGVAYVLGAMNGQIRQILDVTIVYPERKVSFWQFVRGRITHIRVHASAIPVSDSLVGDYARDRAFRRRFQQWLNQLWSEKDALIEQMKTTTENRLFEESTDPASCRQLR
jgi:1-acyl-sn-glycerol-3-phosphate acyltransferase